MTDLDESPMAADKRISTWTNREEAQLKELMDRKVRIISEQTKQLARIIGVTATSADELQFVCAALISKATEVRAALRPFDDQKTINAAAQLSNAHTETTEHDWREDGLLPHNGEHWYKCLRCGAKDWIASYGSLHQLKPIECTPK